MRFCLQSVYARRIGFTIVADVLCFLFAAFSAWLILRPPFTPLEWGLVTAVGAAAGVLVLCHCQAYRPTWLGDSRRSMWCILSAMGVTLGFVLVAFFAVDVPEQTTTFLAWIGAIYFPVLILQRECLPTLLSLPRFRRRVLVVGTSDLGRSIARAVAVRANMGIEVVGFLSDAPDDLGELVEDRPVLGKIHELEKVVDLNRIDWIVVASRRRDEPFPEDALLAAKFSGLRVDSGVSFYERVTNHLYVRDLRPSSLIFAPGFRRSLVSAGIKRGIDIFASAVGLLLTAPLMGLCALAIRLDSAGPVFYRQTRVGRGGRPFTMCKLRSMVDGAEEDTGPIWTTEGDDRITRVGRALRRTRLDEVPQLWNVLIGEMSLVGPRPERPEFEELIADHVPYFKLRAAQRPGVTGWAQIWHGYVGDVEGSEQKLAYDLYYLKHQSLSMDLAILWHTVGTLAVFDGY